MTSLTSSPAGFVARPKSQDAPIFLAATTYVPPVSMPDYGSEDLAARLKVVDLTFEPVIVRSPLAQFGDFLKRSTLAVVGGGVLTLAVLVPTILCAVPAGAEAAASADIHGGNIAASEQLHNLHCSGNPFDSTNVYC